MMTVDAMYWEEYDLIHANRGKDEAGMEAALREGETPAVPNEYEPVAFAFLIDTLPFIV